MKSPQRYHGQSTIISDFYYNSVDFIFQGAEFVIALTHMRVPNDRRLAEEAAGIDLILGGHDHDYFVQKV